MARSMVASLYQFEGKEAEAEPILRQAVKASEELRGPNDLPALMGLELLAQTYEAQDRFLEAERLLRRNVEFRRQFQGPEHVDLCKAYLRLGFQAARLGRPEDAELCYRRSIAIAKKNNKPVEPYAIVSRITLADLVERGSIARSGGALQGSHLPGFWLPASEDPEDRRVVAPGTALRGSSPLF